MADEKNNIPKRGNAYKGFSSRADNSNFKLYDFELIKQDLMNRLSVRKGERVENPAFGTIIYDALFEPLTEATRQLIIDDVTEQLNADQRLATNEIIVEEYDDMYLYIYRGGLNMCVYLNAYIIKEIYFEEK